MKIMLVGGGTAGHINPALALANYIKKECPDAEIFYVGTPFGMEAKLVPQAGFLFVPIRVRGFQRKLTLQNVFRNLQALYYLTASQLSARVILKKYKPDVVVGTGGYVSGPLVRLAAKQGIKTAIHEQNAFPGVTTRLLSRYVDVVMAANEQAKNRLPQAKNIVVVGNPVRSEIVMATKSEARKRLGLDDAFTILSYGGSLGALTINTICSELMAFECNNKLKINHIHGCGRYGTELVPRLLSEKAPDFKENKRLHILEYINDMAGAMAAADLVICRAGAITLSELAAAAKPAILIPSPNVAENHQYHNAMALAEAGAAIVMEDKNVSGGWLIEAVQKLYQDKEALSRMSHAAGELAVLDSDARMYKEIIKIMENPS